MEGHSSISDQGASLKSSEIFHLCREPSKSPTNFWITLCTTNLSNKPGGKYQIEDIENFIEDGKRLCIQCREAAANIHSVDVNTCDICGRLNEFIEAPIEGFDVAYKVKEDEKAYICLNCKIVVSDL